MKNRKKALFGLLFATSIVTGQLGPLELEAMEREFIDPKGPTAGVTKEVYQMLDAAKGDVLLFGGGGQAKDGQKAAGKGISFERNKVDVHR